MIPDQVDEVLREVQGARKELRAITADVKILVVELAYLRKLKVAVREALDNGADLADLQQAAKLMELM